MEDNIIKLHGGRMDNLTLIVIVVLILALLFFGYSMLNSGNSGVSKSYSAPAPSYVGGGCGR